MVLSWLYMRHRPCRGFQASFKSWLIDTFLKTRMTKKMDIRQSGTMGRLRSASSSSSSSSARNMRGPSANAGGKAVSMMLVPGSTNGNGAEEKDESMFRDGDAFYIVEQEEFCKHASKSRTKVSRLYVFFSFVRVAIREAHVKLVLTPGMHMCLSWFEQSRFCQGTATSEGALRHQMQSRL